ncbi:tRNA preQ1(34) S-adenosylmethionine ribosyltransferase-isomerase QueA [Candidatus Melainabacteria bacterium MEL.A1]|nr:tRNA preQ1(34) S-adenosylmethionine ribosyltransferase-isomerase QueA [Candidatus Melainabacteria bacterium MEL.A1]DAA85897.1 MAG TPA: tRNA preQ1(34) S-adenosylmethionine ribosyltransferase-isomerase QueA [Candidatus Gastranaerophilales bacterium HUM_2]
MLISEYDYNLPEELIAQMPADKRDNSRMMVLNRKDRTISHKHFYDIVDLIEPNTLLVMNNTKVLPARLIGHKDTGAKIEVFLLKQNSKMQDEHENWEVLIKPSKRVKPDTIIKISDELSVRAIKRLEENGEWLVELIFNGNNVLDVLHRNGNIPLPPYIERKIPNEDLKKLDFERYQTVYAKDEGSVAAPTAGLHFTKEILKKLENKGVELAYVTLNVGLGTFRPVQCENVENHKMHSETFEISEKAAEQINRAKAEGKKIVAVGTTTVRTLETAYKKFGCIKACHDHSELFIYPPYEFKVIDNLITNFHLPKSTLLMLVSALAGKDFIFEAYKEAIENKYRFFSYGDCMYIC